MKVLVLNCGSSSIKFQLFDMQKDITLAKGSGRKSWNQRFICETGEGKWG